MRNENPIIDWLEKSNKKCLRFTFKERLFEQNATEAIQKWREAFASFPDGQIVIIWNCLEMKGYDNASRILWQKALKEMRDQIDSIWLITNNSFIKYGASLMSTFSSMKINVVRSEDKIKLTP